GGSIAHGRSFQHLSGILQALDKHRPDCGWQLLCFQPVRIFGCSPERPSRNCDNPPFSSKQARSDIRRLFANLSLENPSRWRDTSRLPTYSPEAKSKRRSEEHTSELQSRSDLV